MAVENCKFSPFFNITDSGPFLLLGWSFMKKEPLINEKNTNEYETKICSGFISISFAYLSQIFFHSLQVGYVEHPRGK